MNSCNAQSKLYGKIFFPVLNVIKIIIRSRVRQQVWNRCPLTPQYAQFKSMAGPFVGSGQALGLAPHPLHTLLQLSCGALSLSICHT